MCPQDACSRDGSTFAVWTRWAEDSAEGKRHQKSTYTDVYGLFDGPQKRLYIYIIISFSLSPYVYIYIYIYMYLALVLQKKEYATKFRIPNTSDLVNIQLLHPSNLPGFAIFASLAMPYSPNISIYPLNSPRTRIQMMMTPCWASQDHVIPNLTAGSWRRSLFFVGNHYVHCVLGSIRWYFRGTHRCVITLRDLYPNDPCNESQSKSAVSVSKRFVEL